jgi:2-keto-4-pentenoate hydratase
MSPMGDAYTPAATAETIWGAWQGKRTLEALPDAVRPGTFEEGWAAQRALEHFAGERYGWKLAATTEAGRRHINVDGPLIGTLFARFRHEPGDTLPATHLTMRVIEAEYAFRLARDLPGPGPYSRADVLDAVASAHLAVEVPDTRFEQFASVGAPSLLADDACAGMFVLGPAIPDWGSVDLAGLPVRLLVNGEVAGTGSGANVMGDPREALTWCANELLRLGNSLVAGDIVTTGTTTVPPPVGPGDAIEADFGELGRVALQLR